VAVVAASCNGGEKPDTSEAIERTFAFSGRSPTSCTAIDLGGLLGGKTVIVRFKLQNNTSTPFRIKQSSMGANWMKAKVSSDVIESQNSVDLEIEMKVPTKFIKDTVTTTVRIEESETSVLQLGLTYRPLGIACFRTDAVSHNLLHNLKACEFRIPLLITPPSKAEDVVAFGSGNFSSLQSKVISVDGEEFLSCKIKIPEEGEIAWGGELGIKDTRTGLTQTIPCFIGRELPIVILPRTTRFNLEKQRYEASVLIRDNRGVTPVADLARPKGNANDDISIGCVSDNGIKVDVESTKVGPTLYRVTLSLKTEEKKLFETKLPSKLHWQFGWEGGISEQKTNVAQR
jgi:hypothetical protein